MIVYTHHSFWDKPPPTFKTPRRKAATKSPPTTAPPKINLHKTRDLESERARKRAYYQKHKDEIKARHLKKEVSQ